MKIEIDTTSKSVSLEISGTYTAQELSALLQKIGQAKAQITEQTANPAGVQMELVINPAYWTQFGPTTGSNSCLALSHPLYGWLAFAFPMIEAARLAKYMNEHLVASMTATAAPAAADFTLSGGGVLH